MTEDGSHLVAVVADPARHHWRGEPGRGRRHHGAERVGQDNLHLALGGKEPRQAHRRYIVQRRAQADGQGLQEKPGFREPGLELGLDPCSIFRSDEPPRGRGGASPMAALRFFSDFGRFS